MVLEVINIFERDIENFLSLKLIDKGKKFEKLLNLNLFESEILEFSHQMSGVHGVGRS